MRPRKASCGGGGGGSGGAAYQWEATKFYPSWQTPCVKQGERGFVRRGWRLNRGEVVVHPCSAQKRNRPCHVSCPRKNVHLMCRVKLLGRAYSRYLH